MKVIIESEDQLEFDEKRESLIKAIAGSKLDVQISKKGQKKASEPRPPYFRSQKEILEHWDDKFKDMIKEIKREVGEIIG